MRKVYRYEDNADYWDRRWQEAGVDRRGFEDLSIYPISYAQRIMAHRPARTLEIGSGSGRVLMHYHYRGHRICGIERSEVAVQQLKAFDPDLDVRVGDALALAFEDEAFNAVLAFGVYHNLEEGIAKGFREVGRVLAKGGHFAISMRPDNLEMNLNEVYWRWQHRDRRHNGSFFHKMLIGESEGVRLLEQAGLKVTQVLRARNMPILYRFPFLRESGPSDEAGRRAAGYRLNARGQLLDRALRGVAPRQFCNVIVYEGIKP